jgi:hypothetical protein
MAVHGSHSTPLNNRNHHIRQLREVIFHAIEIYSLCWNILEVPDASIDTSF